MPCYLSTNMKRKELESDHLHDDVFDFTLSSPARKIRRLDADLPPIIELEEPDSASRFEQQPFSGFRSSDGGESRLRGLVIEELPPENQERAIVLFNPINTPLYHSPSHFVVDSDLISNIKDQAVREINSKSRRSMKEKESKTDEQLAIIPRVSSQQSHQAMPPEVSEMEVCEPMDAEQVGATMEAEENSVSPGVEQTKGFNQLNWSSENLLNQFWQQQHCMVPQPPHNAVATPIVWYR